MKYVTKENVLLVLVSLLVLAQVKELWGESKAPERSRAAIAERMRGMAYGGQERPRMAPQRPLPGEWKSGQRGGAAMREKKKKEAKDQ